jgi:pyrimidine deaminase RibD-like protein
LQVLSFLLDNSNTTSDDNAELQAAVPVLWGQKLLLKLKTDASKGAGMPMGEAAMGHVVVQTMRQCVQIVSTKSCLDAVIATAVAARLAALCIEHQVLDLATAAELRSTAAACHPVTDASRQIAMGCLVNMRILLPVR